MSMSGTRDEHKLQRFFKIFVKITDQDIFQQSTLKTAIIVISFQSLPLIRNLHAAA